MGSNCRELGNCRVNSKCLNAPSSSRPAQSGHGRSSIYADLVVETPIWRVPESGQAVVVVGGGRGLGGVGGTRAEIGCAHFNQLGRRGGSGV